VLGASAEPRGGEQKGGAGVKAVAILMVGLPNAGKSAVAFNLDVHGGHHVIVSPDAIRLVLGHRYFAPLEPFVSAFALMFSRMLIETGYKTIVIDDCNHTQVRRAWWTANLADVADTAICWVAPDKTVCLQREDCRVRARRDGDTHLLKAIDETAREFEDPTVEWVIPGRGPERLYICGRMRELLTNRASGRFVDFGSVTPGTCFSVKDMRKPQETEPGGLV
jgi:predicted kinase